MDMIQDWASYFLTSSNPYTPYFRQILSATSTAKAYMLPLIDRVSQKPDLATIALLLIIFFLSLKLLDMLWQAVMFWLRLVRRIVFWGGLALLGLWMYNRGPEGAMEDIGYWFDVWAGEYRYWKEQAETARMVRDRVGNGRGRGGGAGDGWY